MEKSTPPSAPIASFFFTPEDRERLPHSPGVYCFYDHADRLLYVGKAKDLRRRVAQYFAPERQLHLRVRAMVQKISKLSCTVVQNEAEAFLLENNLIKAHQPRYNVLLKDGKTYPYLCLTAERFPRLIKTRQRYPPLGEYFGPFANVQLLEEVTALIKRLYPLRTCRLDLSPAKIAARKYRVCLQYHIGNCLGPCEGLQTEANYMEKVGAIRTLLKGDLRTIRQEMRQEMLAAAQQEDFVQAQRCKKRLVLLEQYEARSIIVHTRWKDLDVIALIEGEQYAYASYIHLVDGRILFTDTASMQKKLGEEAPEELLQLALFHFRQRSGSQARCILSNIQFAPLSDTEKVELPRLGDKRKLVEMALQNGYLSKREQLYQETAVRKRTHAALEVLQQALHLPDLPRHIECFDNSNLQGSHPVAAMVAFRDGLPEKTGYRHFHIRTVTGANDFASMAEVVSRRYQKLAEEGMPLPDLIMVDGGKGQLSAAWAALQDLGLTERVAILAIAKKLEYLYTPHSSEPIVLEKGSPALLLLQQIRDEAHRFALSFHRATHQKQALRSRLLEIPGIGPRTIEKLFGRFGSLEDLQKADLSALVELVGRQKAEQLMELTGEERPRA